MSDGGSIGGPRELKGLIKATGNELNNLKKTAVSQVIKSSTTPPQQTTHKSSTQYAAEDQEKLKQIRSGLDMERMLAPTSQPSAEQSQGPISEQSFKSSQVDLGTSKSSTQPNIQVSQAINPREKGNQFKG